MTETPQEDLLGFVLGALEADEQARIQEKIDADPKLDEELLRIKSSLAPLELVNGSSGYRAGLARRTCEWVACETNATDHGETCYFVEPKARQAIERSLVRNSSWSKRDFLVMAASLAVVATMLLPVLSYTKRQSNLMACGNNLRNVGLALANFSEINNGRFVEIPSEGSLSFAGVVAPMLKEAKLIEEDSVFTCQAVKRDKPFLIPTTQQIRQSSDSEQGDYLRRIASGDFGYTFGHMDGDRYVPPQNLGRDYVVIAADKPSAAVIGGPSPNHGGRGQNCLFEDMHVAYVSGNTVGDDQIYVNAHNIVGPGVDRRDSVIGASHLSPRNSVSFGRNQF